MASHSTAAVASFIEGAPPGELADVVTDIKALDPSLLSGLDKAFEKYNHEQFTTVKLPGAAQPVIVSSFNLLEDGRYYDPESKTSFVFDHKTQKASSPQSYIHESGHSHLIASILKSLSVHVSEHFPSASFSAYPTSSGDSVAVITVANKYSPGNFWNGRWRSFYLYEPSSGALKGEIKVDVHYYEDGNVRLLTDKPISATVSSSSASAIVKEIAVVEKKYQEDLNRGFLNLSEGAFKGLRRQLPITRQKIEWEKISGYRLGQDIGGGRTR